ncbi:hypothetical protein D3C81_1075070 [compost metagenome]
MSRQPAAALGGLAADLRMQRADRRDHAVVQIAAEHERRGQARQQAGGALRVRRVERRYHAALDPGVALPFAPLHHQVFLQHAQAARQRTGIAIGPQPHVDAEHVAVGGHLGKQVDQAAAEADEVLMVGQAARAALRVAVFVIQEDQVDIGRDIELAPAELAHADHHQLLHLAALLPDRVAEGRG